MTAHFQEHALCSAYTLQPIIVIWILVRIVNNFYSAILIKEHANRKSYKSRPILIAWICVNTKLAIGQCRLGVPGTCGLNNPWQHLWKMS